MTHVDLDGLLVQLLEGLSEWFGTYELFLEYHFQRLPEALQIVKVEINIPFPSAPQGEHC